MALRQTVRGLSQQLTSVAALARSGGAGCLTDTSSSGMFRQTGTSTASGAISRVVGRAGAAATAASRGGGGSNISGGGFGSFIARRRGYSGGGSDQPSAAAGGAKATPTPSSTKTPDRLRGPNPLANRAREFAFSLYLSTRCPLLLPDSRVLTHLHRPASTASCRLSIRRMRVLDGIPSAACMPHLRGTIFQCRTDHSR